MVHELTFASIHGLVVAYERVAEMPGTQGCEIDLDRLQLCFTTRFPLAEAASRALAAAHGLVSARCWPSPPPLFAFARADQSAIDSSTSITGIPSSTG
jgi:hypothetical protein